MDLPEGTVVLAPSHIPGLQDERAAFLRALDAPVGSVPLRTRVTPQDRVCIVFTDITRPTPNHRIIPWLLGYLGDCGVPDAQIVLLSATGTHRPNSQAELERLLTPAVLARYRVINHACEDKPDLVSLGRSPLGTPAWISRHFMEATVRIVTGFIEPHFFAGFSGGPKGIMPGIAGLESVMVNHGYGPIASPQAAFGVLQGNPVWEDMADIARMAGNSFLVNVSLNKERQLTGIFAGELFAAHARGTDFVRRSAMTAVEHPFDIVVTTNNGYPLDQNLYQGIKGLSAASRIVKEGGMIIMAAECREGLPTGSPFEHLLYGSKSMEDLLARMSAPDFRQAEQWQVQIMGRILRHARVHLYSSLDASVVRRSHLIPCDAIAERVRQEVARIGSTARVAVLPEGPMVIPYLLE